MRLIVRVRGDPSAAKARFSELGVKVLRSFTLINAVAVSCTAKTALVLLKEPWVERVEEDRQLTVQERGGGADPASIGRGR